MPLRDNATFILSRTDSIGDVVLTLPMAGWLKKQYPHCKIFFLARTYTKDVILWSEYVEEFINFDELEKLPFNEQVSEIKKYKADVFVHVFPVKKIAQLAKAAQIPTRVGTTNRLFHWFNCNKLIQLSRKNSSLHESQLNFKLFEFLDVSTSVSLSEISSYYGFTRTTALNDSFIKLIRKEKCNVILHPKSKGSAKEWGLDNFEKLIRLLPPQKYNVFVSGTKADGEQMQEFLKKNKEVMDITGQMNLNQFISFIHHCDALVAASTGPLHIAAALNKIAIGLFSPKRPIHPGRWMPVGKRAGYLVFDANCTKCKNGEDCNCITKISPQQVVDLLEREQF